MRAKVVCSAIVALLVIGNFGIVLVNEQTTDGIIAAHIETKASGTTYYAAKNGNDSNPGTEDQPWLTIQKAADAMAAGDTCIVLPGFYDERVQIMESGSLDAPITYKAEGSVINHGFTTYANHIHITGFEITDTESMDGYNDPAQSAGVYIEGKYCEIINNNIHDVTCSGIVVYTLPIDSPATSYNVIKDNCISYAGCGGISVAGRNNLIENNDISHIIQKPPKWTNPPPGADADGILFFGSGHIIRRNYIHDILMSDPGNDDPHIDVAQTWGPAYNIIFEQNIFENSNRGHQGVYCEQLSGDIHNITLWNNIFIMDSDGDYLPGINIESSISGWVEDIVIVSNTFIRPAGVGEYAIWLRDVRNVKVMNNIFYDYGKESCPYLQLGSVEELEVGYNCVYTSNGVPPTGGAYPNDLWMVYPEFVDFANNNFHLRADSPLIDTGTNLAGIVDNDFDGNKRPYGDGYDIGAFEYQGNDDYNLDCNGILRWANVKPGSVVNGSFTVENVGDPGLEIDWCITEWPSWGTWTFTPISGDDLSPEDGPVTVEVSVVAPDEQNKGFTGSIKIVNKDNINDFCMVPVSLATPKNKQMISTLFIQFLEIVIERFPMLEWILKLPSL